ncbi:hypothetical protein WICPIJ_006726 [Wickerhamomyces pijperi]|uniref:Uncharacterized protein n=1 Tax=Wickerhamomyces pijperi TaxID=599730 RepID=A0A9P8TL48_WICPI|nr:hypothetical protein WICPIJ_006726 [Wickerhamomyces pijperi]
MFKAEDSFLNRSMVSLSSEIRPFAVSSWDSNWLFSALAVVNSSFTCSNSTWDSFIFVKIVFMDDILPSKASYCEENLSLSSVISSIVAFSWEISASKQDILVMSSGKDSKGLAVSLRSSLDLESSTSGSAAASDSFSCVDSTGSSTASFDS